MKSLLPTILASCAVILAGSSALWAGTSGLRAFTTETERRVALQETPRELTPVLLENHEGTPRALGRPGRSHQVVGFIYTRCPTTCVAMGREFAQLQAALKERELSDRVELLSVSFDSRNESPRTLAAYLDRHAAETDLWQALRFSDPEPERRLLKEFGVTIVPDGYGGFVHNAAFHLVESNRLIGVYDYADVRSIVDEISERAKGS